MGKRLAQGIEQISFRSFNLAPINVSHYNSNKNTKNHIQSGRCFPVL